MKLTQKPKKRARIEIIPMIDVIFFLLVFFMVSSLALTQMNTLPVSLPHTSHSPTALKQSVILTLKKDGTLYVNKAQVHLSSLKAQLAYAMHDHPQEVLVINADQKTPYGQVVQAMDQARQIGVRKFALATEASAPEVSQ